jgi:hypothetical protein
VREAGHRGGRLVVLLPPDDDRLDKLATDPPIVSLVTLVLRLTSRSAPGNESGGARDDYPDRRLMGYPFNRPFERSLAETIAAEPNMAARDVTIRCTTERPGAGG